MMKKILLLAALFFVCLASYGQAVYYSYDAAGNRVKREINITRSPSTSPEERGSYYTDTLSDTCHIKITPTGRNGVVAIDVIGSSITTDGRATVFDISGMEVLSSLFEEGHCVVDLSGKPSGVYILNIKINGEQTSWKITKL